MEMSLDLRRALVVVGVTRYGVLLPIADGNLEHAHRRVAGAGHVVFGVAGDPDLGTGRIRALPISAVNQRAIVNDDPQLGAPVTSPVCGSKFDGSRAVGSMRVRF